MRMFKYAILYTACIACIFLTICALFLYLFNGTKDHDLLMFLFYYAGMQAAAKALKVMDEKNNTPV